jgi:Cyclin, C-terminal domain
VYVSDYCFDKQQLHGLESQVCNHLQFRLHLVTPLHYVNLLLRAGHPCACTSCRHDHPTVRHLVMYLLQLGRLSWKLAHLPPSQVAAGAVYLARLCFHQRYRSVDGVDEGYWPKTLQYYSGYTCNDIVPVVYTLLKYQLNAESTQAKVYNLYNTAKYSYASLRCPPPIEDIEKEIPNLYHTSIGSMRGSSKVYENV